MMQKQSACQDDYLIDQQNQRLMQPSSQPNDPKQQIRQHSISSTKNALLYCIYTILLTLALILLSDILYFIDVHEYLNKIAEKAQINQEINSIVNYQALQSIKSKVKQEQKSQMLYEAHQKQLRLLQLQREMFKITSALKSKQQYDTLIKNIQQKRKKINSINYWDFNKLLLEKPQPIQTSIKTDKQYIPDIVIKEEDTHFPKIVWLYVEKNISEQSNLTKIFISNIAKYLQLQGYNFYIIGSQNFRQLMSNRHEVQLGYMLLDLEHLAFETNLTKNLKDHFLTIKKHLISLIMLAQMGGILIDKELIMTQPLDWLYNFKNLSLANKGRSQIPNVIGFYHANYTSSMDQIELQGGEKKQIYLYPPLDPYFLAVSKEGKNFIQEVLQRYYVLLEYPKTLKEIIVKDQLVLKELNGQDPYYEAIFFAFSWVLRIKQLQLQKSWIQSGKLSLRPLALDYYNIFAINRVYGPLKYRFIFSELDKEEIYNYLTKVDYDDLSREFGPISYMAFMPFKNQLEKFTGKAKSGEKAYEIYNKSFMGNYIFKNFSENWISHKNPLKRQFQQKKELQQNSIPKKIWLYSEKKSLLTDLCLMNILKSASASNFQVILLTPQNLNKYLSETLRNKIEKAHMQAKLTIKNKTMTNLWVQMVKLAIMSEHGGIWLDLPMFTLQSFDWILDIHHNMHVINKNGTLLKVLLFYHPIESSFPFTCKKQCITKEELQFQTSFIAAQANVKLFYIWLRSLSQNLAMNEQSFKIKLNKYKIGFKNITTGAELSRITLRYIQTERNQQIGKQDNKDSFFLSQNNIWTLSSFTGLEKFKQYTNFDVGFNGNNIYLWSMPLTKVISLLGDFRYLIHLSPQAETFLNRELQYGQKFRIHPDSLPAKHLIDDKILQALIANRSLGGLDIFVPINKKGAI